MYFCILFYVIFDLFGRGGGQEGIRVLIPFMLKRSKFILIVFFYARIDLKNFVKTQAKTKTYIGYMYTNCNKLLHYALVFDS